MKLSIAHPHRRALTTPLFLLATAAISLADTFPVPGSANPWLAGMPDGTALVLDTAPGQSPVWLGGFNPGDLINFSASGLTSYNAVIESGPDGLVGSTFTHAAAFGIGGMIGSSASALIGVFLDATQPDSSAAPASLDFTTAASRDYLILSPGLKQMFFIGDGQTSGAVQQAIEAPAGATRLFLGTTDGFNWFNNTGTLTVTGNNVSVVPEPTGTVLLAAGASLLALWRRRAALAAPRV